VDQKPKNLMIRQQSPALYCSLPAVHTQKQTISFNLKTMSKERRKEKKRRGEKDSTVW